MRLIPTIAVALLTAACVQPTASLPTYKQTPEEKSAAFRAETQAAVEVQNLMWRMARAAGDFCGTDTVYSSGIITATMEDVPEQYRDVAGNIGFSNGVSILGTADKSPGGDAGLRRGDAVSKIGPKKIPDGKAGVKFLDNEIAKSSGGSVVLTINRAGAETTKEIALQKVCNYTYRFVESADINAYATGSSIAITSAMLKFFKSPEEMALVVGHEMAHNFRSHIRAVMINRIPGSILDATIAVVFGAPMTGIFSDMTMTAFSPEFELEADYVGLYVAARAGYDISSAVEFWQRFGAKVPRAGVRSRTHPGSDERFRLMQATIQEINSKKANGEPLVPNEKKQ